MSIPDQIHGGSFNAHKNWKKLRAKHQKREASRKRGIDPGPKPELYTPNKQTIEGSERIVSKELYNLNYDLAFGKITQEEYNELREELGE